ncbi:MAG TPA: aminotransferase class I/II-fold pyridoxal phosphate-dependent enzyme [Bacteroidales bacterium]|nr:aminotransferase class I/II-fold pyridoxal phosphate-dependent enzyme [Bacteroidales bacterium]HRZ76652.1 aminotransferase class I/II-fold pyridoxal phosphate-dependent enzyme [Bacteroidales bacterium]
MDPKNLRINSQLIHAGEIDDCLGSATVPIYQTSTFRFRNVDHGAACFAGEDPGYIYTRIGNPTIQALEEAVAILERGVAGIATSSGMAAITAVYHAFLGAGAHIVSHDALYGPARGVMESLFAKFGVESTYVDTTDLDNVRKAIQPNTALIYTETPANPTMGITDIAGLAAIAREHHIPLCVDNTFSSPVLQRPLELGADISLHSMTKFINGHADIVAGMVVTRTPEHGKLVRNVMVNMGSNMDPHQAYLVLRGLKTLGIRVERAQQNAMKVAEYLQAHPKVEWIKYPGLSSHPQYELALRQMMGPGTMISFGLKGGLQAGKTLMNSVRLALLAVSLGGVETLIQHPASMTHSKLGPEHRAKAGITDGLVRFSVGIEDVEDIIADLDQALEKV